MEQVLNRRESVKLLTADRRRQLHASAAYHHFCSEANDLDDFIQDKMRTATDQSYKYCLFIFHSFTEILEHIFTLTI